MSAYRELKYCVCGDRVYCKGKCKKCYHAQLKANKLYNECKKETIFYTNLWDSLHYSELLSMRKSNIFSRKLMRHYKLYMIFRLIKESMPIIAIGIVGALVLKVLKNESK